LVAGQEPVTNQIGNAILGLLQNPEQLQNLRKCRTINNAALNELLRYGNACELTTWRFFSSPTNLFGASIAAGDGVIVSLNAANRDPKKFKCPHLMDLERPDNTPLNFGFDHHRCPASSLVKLELEISVQHILERLPNLRLACPAYKLKWVSAPFTHGLRKLPVLFGPSPKKK
jgi:cytochrome P450